MRSDVTPSAARCDCCGVLGRPLHLWQAAPPVRACIACIDALWSATADVDQVGRDEVTKPRGRDVQADASDGRPPWRPDDLYPTH